MKTIVNKMKILTASLLLAVGFGMTLAPLHVSALGDASKSQVCSSIGAANCSSDGTGISSIIKVVINLISLVVGLIAVIMVIVGGFKYITSAGESSKVASAKNTIIYAVIGLVIVALAQFLVQFVLHTATTTNSSPTVTNTPAPKPVPGKPLKPS